MEMGVASFIDRVRLQVRGGDGGRGCVSFRREKYVPRGGPNGGDGGRGGDVILVGNPQVGTLLDFTYRRLFRAENGTHGSGANKRGADGQDLHLDVPLGTVVRLQAGEVLGEVLRAGQEFVVARGGQGGRGNASFKSATNRAPRMAQPGMPGEDRRIALELKLIADAGLVGQPNAGKSTLLAALSAATPEIADYPFTTRSPVLGVVRAGEERSFVLADIPGLLEGAHRGRGLGLEFLRHVERTRLLLFVLDVAAPHCDRQLQLLRDEVAQYQPGLATRPYLVVLNKRDLVGNEELQEARRQLPPDEDVVVVSGLQRRGLQELVHEIVTRLDALSASENADPNDPANLPES
jgi:GTP-binding protein